jgi:hypothetical protein
MKLPKCLNTKLNTGFNKRNLAVLSHKDKISLFSEFDLAISK